MLTFDMALLSFCACDDDIQFIVKHIAIIQLFVSGGGHFGLTIITYKLVISLFKLSSPN